MLGKGALSIKPLKKYLFIRWVNLVGMLKNVKWHASTHQEKKEIEASFGKHCDIVVAENLAMLPVNVKPRSIKIAQNKLSVLFVSRVSEKKNLKFLIESIATLKRKKDVKLTIVGPKEDLQYFEECNMLAKTNELNLIYLEPMANEKLREVYLSADVFCLPTLHENYGHVIVEAMSYGLPVLLSKKTNVLNLESKNIGFDLDLEIDQFSEKLNWFLELDSEAYSEMSVKALKYAEVIIKNKKNIEANQELFQIA